MPLPNGTISRLSFIMTLNGVTCQSSVGVLNEGDASNLEVQQDLSDFATDRIDTFRDLFSTELKFTQLLLDPLSVVTEPSFAVTVVLDGTEPAPALPTFDYLRTRIKYVDPVPGNWYSNWNHWPGIPKDKVKEGVITAAYGAAFLGELQNLFQDYGPRPGINYKFQALFRAPGPPPTYQSFNIQFLEIGNRIFTLQGRKR